MIILSDISERKKPDGFTYMDIMKAKELEKIKGNEIYLLDLVKTIIVSSGKGWVVERMGRGIFLMVDGLLLDSGYIKSYIIHRCV